MGEITENVQSNPKRKFMIVALVFGILASLFLFAWWLWGRGGLGKVLTGFLVLMVIAVIVFMIGFLIVKLIFPPKPNMLSILKTRLAQGASMRAPEGNVKVYLAGDKKDYERRFIGLLKGISETVLPPEFDKENKSVLKGSKAERFLFLMVKQGAFKEVKIIGVKRGDISNPSMDELYILDRTLTPPFGGIYFPSKYSEQSRIIEVPVTNYVKRYTLEGLLKDLKIIVDDAVQSNPQHQKNLENKGVFERIGEVGEND